MNIIGENDNIKFIGSTPGIIFSLLGLTIASLLLTNIMFDLFDG